MADGVESTTEFNDWEVLRWSESDAGTTSDGESQGFEVIDEDAAASSEDAGREAGRETRDRIDSNYSSVGFAEREVGVTGNSRSDADLRGVQRPWGSPRSRESQEELAPAAAESRSGDSVEAREEAVGMVGEELWDSSVGLLEEAGYDDATSELNWAAAPSGSPTWSVADSSEEGEGFRDIGELDHPKCESPRNECPTSVLCTSENEFSGECSEPVEAANIGNCELSPDDSHVQSDQMHILTEKGGKLSGDSKCMSERASVIWWKLPLELLKFCAFKVRPVWSISFAAAMVAAVMLTRRLNKLRRPTRRLPFTVCVDDKKVSQFLVTARLNTAYPLAKHAPVIKAPLRIDEITPWLAMTLR